jgi:hypothetical protein
MRKPAQKREAVSRPTRVLFGKPIPDTVVPEVARAFRRVLPRLPPTPDGKPQRRLNSPSSCRTIQVAETWIEEDVGDWRAAYRLGVDVTGAVVVSEFRLYPRAEALEPGQWLGEWMGVEAPGVPAGGVRARTIRECRVGVRLASAANIAREDLLGLIHRGYGSFAPVRTEAEREALASGKRGRGRPPTTPVAGLKRLADRYTELCRGNRDRPLYDTLMGEFGVTRDQVKARLKRCRQLGLLA